MLVGREPERLLIAETLAGARVGSSRVLVLSGEPGIGKTSLLGEAERLIGDMRVLRCEGVEAEQYVPFAGLHQLLHPVLDLVDEIPAPQSRALSSALLLGSERETEPSRFAVGAATLSLLSRAAEDRPLTVLVDDAHLLDAPSAEALVFAARRLVSDPIALLVAVRENEPGREVWATLPTHRIEGLDLAAVTELLDRSSVRRDSATHLLEATAGNPLALIELGDRGFDATPIDAPLTISDRLSRSFLGRVAELDASTRTALLVAAADGTSLAAVRDACAALGEPKATLSAAEEAGLIEVHADRVEFRHPLVRSAVYGAADLATRRGVHRALASVLPPDQADRIAWHLSQGAGEPDDETADTLDRAAQRAAGRGAYAIATEAHERAAALSVTPTLVAPRLAAAADSAWLAGMTDRTLDLLDRALTRQPDIALRTHLHELRGAVETRTGSLDSALATLTKAADEIRETDPDAAIRLYADAIHVSFYLLAPAAAMRAATSIEQLLDRAVDPEAKALGSLATGMAMVLSGSGAPGIDRLRGAAYDLVTSEPGPPDRLRLPLRLQGALWLRDAGQDQRVIANAVEQLRERVALGWLPYVLMQTGRDAATTDRWDDAVGMYQESIRLAAENGHTTDVVVARAGYAVLAARRGDSESCRSEASAALEIAEPNHVRLATLWCRFAFGDLASGAGDAAAAAGHYEQVEALLDETGMADPDQSCAAELVETYVQLGRVEEAAVVADPFLGKALAKDQPWSLARAARARGLLATGSTAEEHFREALALHAKTPDLYETARTQLAFGAHLRRDRRRVDARPLLRAALDAFESLGAAPWADRAAQELAATGESVHRRDLGPVEQLTPQERQVAQLLAAGRTTREAAATLFISPKTVEYHLRHVYQKLGVRSRDALAGVLGADSSI